MHGTLDIILSISLLNFILLRSSVLHYVDAEGQPRILSEFYTKFLIQTPDSPPTSCSVDESRDCPDGKCICMSSKHVLEEHELRKSSDGHRKLHIPCRRHLPVSDSTSGSSQVLGSCKLHITGQWMLALLTDVFPQFIGDIGQPLHVEATAVGGNSISVKCSGTTTNLHSVSIRVIYFTRTSH